MDAPLPASQLHVALFGKHPGWDDHMECMERAGDRLVRLKVMLYLDGLRPCIDSGRWDQLPESERLAGFGHVFFWMGDGYAAAGRLWNSQDGKGRARYPLVAALEDTSRSAVWHLDVGLPLLESFQRTCQQAVSSSAVAAATAAVHRQLLAAPEPAAPRPRGFEGSQGPGELVRDPGLGPGGIGFQRLLYRLERESAEYLAATPPGPGTTCRHLRLPALAADGGASMGQWAVVLGLLLKPAAPRLLIRPLHAKWVDVLIGRPRAQDFFCVLAGAGSIPLVTDIPYQVDSALQERAEALAARWRASEEWLTVWSRCVQDDRRNASGWRALMDRLGLPAATANQK